MEVGAWFVQGFVPGIQIVESGRKIDEENKNGRQNGKGRKLASLSLRSFPLVSSVYDLTRSPPSEHRTLLTDRLEQASPW